METTEKNGLTGNIALPSVGLSYNLSWENLKKNFVELLLLIVISIAAIYFSVDSLQNPA